MGIPGTAMAVLGLADRWPADAVGILADMGVLGVADMVRCRQLQLASKAPVR